MDPPQAGGQRCGVLLGLSLPAVPGHAAPFGLQSLRFAVQHPAQSSLFLLDVRLGHRNGDGEQAECRCGQERRVVLQRPDGLGECHARFPSVPILFCETRALAQEWTYRFLAASLQEAIEESGGQDRVADLATAKPPSMADVRAWAVAAGYAVAPRGRIAAEVIAAHERRNQ